MPTEIAEVALLRQLRDLRRSRRRFSASIITTYTINFPFYENVILRYLLGAGCRLNVVLADAGEMAKAFLTESARPHTAGIDYLLLPIPANGAFHPKILSLFSDVGMTIAIGSHNLTEAGYGRNAEISATFGFDGPPAPVNVAGSVTKYLLECAGQLAPTDAALSLRLADRLRALSSRGGNAEGEVSFASSRPKGLPLLDQVFSRADFENADRILVLGPYFDVDFRFLVALRERARKAEIVVAIQPEHAIMKRIEGWPVRTRVCDANALKYPKDGVFIHAKGIFIETGKKMVMAIGSANPSGPAWLGNETRPNFESVATLRGNRAVETFRSLGLGELWNAPAISKAQLKLIAARSQAVDETETIGNAPVAGLWKSGWVEAKINSGRKQIRSIRHFIGAVSVDIPPEGSTIEGGVLRFPTPVAGAFVLTFSNAKSQTIVIASSAAALAPSLVSGASERLIDELGRLDNGAVPGDELLNLCEKVLLQPEENEEATKRTGGHPRRASSPQSEDEISGPRGISIDTKQVSSRSQVGLSLDISAIITLLLKDLHVQKENIDPGIEDSEEEDDDTGTKPGDEGLSKAKKRRESRPEWNDIVAAVRPRITRLLRQLSKRLNEERSPKWKYERVLLTLALLKRLRKFHPGRQLAFSGHVTQLVDDNQVREAFKMAMRCLFMREAGIIGALGRVGGVETEHDVVARALLLWAAYEAGTDAAKPANLNVEPDVLKGIQCDRTDALIAAIAASASPSVLERARRELFDRGEWRQPRDHLERLERWYNWHSHIGIKLQKAMDSKRPAHLPVTAETPSINDILIWKAEPGWPRLPQLISGRTIHLSDVGDEGPVKVAAQFVQVVDVKSLGLLV
jgi:hypothetical protein